MASNTVTIQTENGLHTRPAAEFVKLAKSFDSDITIRVGDKDASAKSLFKLQLLGMSKGSELHIESSDQSAVDALCDFVANLD
ncbi:HPr family phosphocarrier protein [Salidesulfovibrio onnuriiensis]|uniref:HPr family phosphocarrier protein n=1 Tax=Salidesulfovibrio onnuriiensis TaxID=2583823 RepID=UPI0011C756F6|nr:HPr family phosphocarrier protein [Salidesulfovibrio onnuriiensis]